MATLTVAIVGGTGYLGKYVTAAFLEALKETGGLLKEVRTLSTKQSDTLTEYEREGAKPFIVDFTSGDSLKQALDGVDVCVSTLGTTGPGAEESGTALIKALSESGVKVYFPSEFGTNHYSRIKNYTNELFEAKRTHFEKAESVGLKTIGLFVGLVMEGSFGPWLGMDPNSETWTLVGKGETPVAVTAESDIGKFAVQATYQAFQSPTTFPKHVEVSSELRTMKEYSEAFDKVAGSTSTLVFTPLQEAVAQYEAEKDFLHLLQILFDEGGFDHTNSNGNELLNSKESIWKLKRIEEFAKETDGRPGKE